MSERAKAFVEAWIEENVHPAAYEPEDDNTQSEANAAACIEAATAQGISKAEIDEEFEDLVAHMAENHESVIDGEIARLVAKDD